MRFFAAVGAAAAFTCAFGNAAAQQYPSKAIRFVVPYVPGGGTDTVARLTGQKLSEALGQAVIIDNRPGAGGVIGGEIVAKSPPDGYTIMLASSSPITVAPHIQKHMPYNPLTDFTPVTLIAIVPALLAVHPALPVKSVKELIALAKAKPGQLTFSSSGNGGTGHVSGEMFKMLAGVDMLHVPYKGTAPATTAVVSGEVSLTFGNMISLLPQVKTGKLRALAVTTAKRSPVLPNIPTVAETLPGYMSGPWYGVLAPAGLPPAILSRLNQELVKIVRSREVSESLRSEGADPIGSSPAEFAAHIASELERMGKVVRKSGMKVD
jgi:tripartite-type tricarboxylate transporter receptor subunit TctC